MKRKLLISVDVEAQPGRSNVEPLERLIWGRFPEGEFGIRAMMDVAERHGVPLTMFLDYAQEFLYGDELIAVGRVIHGRGHDLQMHLHPTFLPDEFFQALGLERRNDLNIVDEPTAEAYVSFLCDRQAAIGAAPLAFRGGGYRYNRALLAALNRMGVRISSSYNISRATNPVNFGPMPQFVWDTGMVELPISTVFDFERTRRHFDYNFNAAVLSSTDSEAAAELHRAFLRRFYSERGTDAIAVLVMSSWSFLTLDSDGVFSAPNPHSLETFERVLRMLNEENVNVIDSRQVVSRLNTGRLRLGGPFQFCSVFSFAPASTTNVAATTVVEHFGVEMSNLHNGTVPSSDIKMSDPVNEFLTRDSCHGTESRTLQVQPINITVTGCPVCNDPLERLGVGNNCTSCGSPPRTRSLAPILSAVVGPILPIQSEDRDPSPLLCFAATSAESRLLTPYFPKRKSVSLYGSYGGDHESGVDVRDLSRYADNSFAGIFSILLFDYFPEHEQALHELYRVTEPGGFLFTCIAEYRLQEGIEPPSVHAHIKPRPGYFEYVPAEADMPSVRVGRDWFISAMSRAGFEAVFVPVTDTASGQILDWFVGRKPEVASSNLEMSQAEESSRSQILDPGCGKNDTALAAPSPNRRITPLIAPRDAPFSKIYSTPVDPDFGFRMVTLGLSVPSLPEGVRSVDFAEHVFDSAAGVATDTVVAFGSGCAVISENLGRSWDMCMVSSTGPIRLWNSFALDDGTRLVQGAPPGDVDRNNPARKPTIFHLDRNWRLLDVSSPTNATWHGSRSIDQQNGIVMFADYPTNSVKYRPDFAARESELRHLCEDSRVFRSRDYGASWETVLCIPWSEIRHFHTIVADRIQTGVWWLSSGDRPAESRIWRSDDDGSTWTDVTAQDPQFPLQQRFEGTRQGAFRYTDVMITGDHLIWGADDWLGSPGKNDALTPLEGQSGSRIFVASKDLPIRPKVAAFVGNPVRSIVDVGPCYVVITEAKHNAVLSRPQVLILGKEPPFRCAEIATIDRYSTTGTGFTYSRSSRASQNGRFFSFRGTHDVFNGGARILQWDIDFQ